MKTDQIGQKPRLTWVRWVHMSFCWFFHVKKTRAIADMALSFKLSDRFQHEKRKFYLFYSFIFLFRLNVAFNNLSVISRRCQDVTGSSMVTLRVLPPWHIAPQTHDVTFHPGTLFWHRTDQFRFVSADLNSFYHNWASAWQNQQHDWAPREESDQHGYPHSLISLRCAINGLLSS